MKKIISAFAIFIIVILIFIKWSSGVVIDACSYISVKGGYMDSELAVVANAHCESNVYGFSQFLLIEDGDDFTTFEVVIFDHKKRIIDARDIKASVIGVVVLELSTTTAEDVHWYFDAASKSEIKTPCMKTVVKLKVNSKDLKDGEVRVEVFSKNHVFKFEVNKQFRIHLNRFAAP